MNGHVGRQIGGRWLRVRIRPAAVAAGVATALAVTALSPAGASAANLPWTYVGGSPVEASGTTFGLTIDNDTSSTQQYQFAFGAPQTLGAGDTASVPSVCGGAQACSEIADFTATSPDLLVSAQGVLANSDGTSTGFFLPQAAFELVGPGGNLFDAVTAAGTADASSLSALKTGQTTLQSLLSPIGAQLGTVQTSLTSLGGQLGTAQTSLTSLGDQLGTVGSSITSLGTAVTGSTPPTGGPSSSSLTNEVASLQTQVGQLSQRIAALTKELAPKRTAKARKKRKK